MAIADKPILDPEPSKPGIPLKKSTLGVLALLLLALGLLSSLALSNSVSSTQGAAVGKDVSELKRTGTDQALKDEEAEAAKRAKLAAASPAAPASSPLPPVPANVRRDDNTSALFDRTGARRTAGRDRDLELEAQTRMAKALITDFDSPPGDQRAAGPGRSMSGSEYAAAGPGNQSAQAPSAAVAGQIDAFTQQLRAAQAGQGAGPRSKEDWVREYAKDAGGQRRVLTAYQAPKRLVLRQGKVIPAVLGRQINSDLPGRITAYVSSNVYDADGRLLVPMGASLIGKYDSGVQVGQSRLMFAFERLVLPNGFSFDLPAAPGADLAGAAGMTGDVDNHFFKMFGTSLLIAVLANEVKQPSSVSNSPGGAITAAGQVLSDVSKTVLERNRVIQPTITVDQGTRINVEVVSDMVFPEQYPLR
jgi:type IV secretion system protein TrbI